MYYIHIHMLESVKYYRGANFSLIGSTYRQEKESCSI